MKDATLCYIFQGGKVLLQKKAKGRFGEGKWNAPGGKIQEGETPKQAAQREVREETGLSVSSLEEKAVIIFTEEGNPPFSVHVYTTNDFSGEVKESEEGKLEWFQASDLPYQSMWEDDRIWLPRILKGEKVRAQFMFSREFKKMRTYTMESL